MGSAVLIAWSQQEGFFTLPNSVDVGLEAVNIIVSSHETDRSV